MNWNEVMDMSLIQMSLSGAIMIFVIMIVRKIGLNRLPKKTFVLLWGIVLLRLLIPFSIPSPISVYSFLENQVFIQQEETERLQQENGITFPVEDTNENIIIIERPTTNPTVQVIEYKENGVNIVFMIWLVGMILCSIIFFVIYFKCYFEFQTSFLVSNDFVANWLEEHPLSRTIQVRQSSKISAPLTYGILKPVILLPKNTDWDNQQELEYILLHEYMHICHFDIVWKIIAIIALCIHWFNPFVWLMYHLFNRDIECVCDECVIQSIGESSRANYARTLIRMEEKNTHFISFVNNFSENATEERIGAIMKAKKVTIMTVVMSIAILLVIVILFATSEKNHSEIEEITTGNETVESTEEQESESKTEEIEIGIVNENIDVSEFVLSSAVEIVRRNLNKDTLYQNWKLDSMEKILTFKHGESENIYEVYSMHYRFLLNEEWIDINDGEIPYIVFEKKELTNGDSSFRYFTDFVHESNPDFILPYIQMYLESQDKNVYNSVFIYEFDGTQISFDRFEWIVVPSEKATELGYTIENTPSGFVMYNEEVVIEKYMVAENCIYKILDWENGYMAVDVNKEEMINHIDTIYQKYKCYPPYRIIIRDDIIVGIFENYVP